MAGIEHPARECPTSTTSAKPAASTSAATDAAARSMVTVLAGAGCAPRPGRSTASTGPASASTTRSQHDAANDPPCTRTSGVMAPAPRSRASARRMTRARRLVPTGRRQPAKWVVMARSATQSTLPRGAKSLLRGGGVALIAIVLLGFGVNAAVRLPCRDACGVDLGRLYEDRGIDRAHPPYIDRDLEYPPVIGIMMYAATVPF